MAGRREGMDKWAIMFWVGIGLLLGVWLLTIKVKVNVSFKWYDMWVGFYWSRKKRILYFLPLPTIVIAFKKR